MTIELLPASSRYTTDEPITIDVRGAAPRRATVVVLHLGTTVTELPLANAGGRLDVGKLPAGGYGIELRDAGTLLGRTAVEVVDPESPIRCLRYGFVTDYRPDRDPSGVADNARRLHLTHVQFYDWAYRHADLLGGGDDYRDALGQPVSLATVRRLIDALAAAGTRSLGYTAVYGVGNAEWSQWDHAALLTPSGKPYSLGDFLQLVDPADEKWLAHLTAELAAAVERLGFHGFHLDQYGYPKMASTPRGDTVHLEDSFATLIAAARRALPRAQLIFNNVNDFPTWRTAGCAQDAVYIEVWPPHVTLGHLADLVTRTRAVSGDKPIVIAAYQHVYEECDGDDVEAADLATALTMATVFSSGATQLLCGEADRILVDPYYVRNRVASPSTRAMLRRWYDFAVEHHELLFCPAAGIDLTGSFAGSYNDDCDVAFSPGVGSSGPVPVTERPTAGAVWRRVMAGPRPGQLVVHLVNLLDQRDTAWDARRAEIITRPAATLRLRRVGAHIPAVAVADPDSAAALTRLTPVTSTEDWTQFELPPLNVWQTVLIELTPGGPLTSTTRTAEAR